MTLQIIFSESLDVLNQKEKAKYEAVILEWLYRHVYPHDLITLSKLDQWKIILHDTYEPIDLERWRSLTTKEQVLTKGIPFGMTNDAVKEVHVWIVDVNNNMVFLQNCFAITHELDHMLLFIFFGNRRAKRRHDDKRFKAGTEAAYATTEVHDRGFEKKYLTVQIYRYDFMGFNFGKITVRGIDVSDLTDSRTIDRPQ